MNITVVMNRVMDKALSSNQREICTMIKLRAIAIGVARTVSVADSLNASLSIFNLTILPFVIFGSTSNCDPVFGAASKG